VGIGVSAYVLIYYTPSVDFDNPASVAECKREKVWEFKKHRKGGSPLMSKDNQLKVTLAVKSVIERGGHYAWSGWREA
jgi:hypothetical protein